MVKSLTVLFTICAIGSFIVQNMSNKEFSRRFSCPMAGMLLFNSCMLLISGLTLGLVSVFSGYSLILPPQTLLLSLVFGITFIVTVLLIVKTMNMGPMGPTVLIINMSMLIPSLYTLIVYREPVTVTAIFGIACMIGVLVLSSLGSVGGTKGGVRWLLLTLLCMFTNGMISVVAEHKTRHFPQIEQLPFLMWAFLMVSAIGFLITYFYYHKAKKVDLQPWLGRKKEFWLCSAGVGLGTAGGNGFQLTVMPFVNSVVLYPLIQGSVVLMLWVLSLVVYHEKPTLTGVLSLIAGVAGIILLSI